MEKYLQHLRAQAILDWKNDEIKKAFDLGVKLRAAEPAIRNATPKGGLDITARGPALTRQRGVAFRLALTRVCPWNEIP